MADCPNGGLPCWGCRGPSAVAFRKMKEGESFEQVLLKSLKQRFRLSDDLITDAVKSIRRRGNSSLCFGNNFLVDSSRLR